MKQHIYSPSSSGIRDDPPDPEQENPPRPSDHFNFVFLEAELFLHSGNFSRPAEPRAGGFLSKHLTGRLMFQTLLLTINEKTLNYKRIFKGLVL